MKKIKLNKQTIANLSYNEMREIQGMSPDTVAWTYTCPGSVFPITLTCPNSVTLTCL